MGGATAGTMLALHGMKIEVLAQGEYSGGQESCNAQVTKTTVIIEEDYASKLQASDNAHLSYQEFIQNPHWDNAGVSHTIPLSQGCAILDPPTQDTQVEVVYEEYLAINGMRWRFTQTITQVINFCTEIV